MSEDALTERGFREILVEALGLSRLKFLLMPGTIPSLPVMGRESVGECEVGGYRMPTGTGALMSQWVVHRDPRYHRDPQRFDPDRWTAEYEKRMLRFAFFPFGGGPRQCIGAAFAMTEACLVLAAVAKRFRMTLVPDQRVEPYASITLRPKEGIRMILAARSQGS